MPPPHQLPAPERSPGRSPGKNTALPQESSCWRVGLRSPRAPGRRASRIFPAVAPPDHTGGRRPPPPAAARSPGAAGGKPGERAPPSWAPPVSPLAACFTCYRFIINQAGGKIHPFLQKGKNSCFHQRFRRRAGALVYPGPPKGPPPRLPFFGGNLRAPPGGGKWQNSVCRSPHGTRCFYSGPGQAPSAEIGRGVADGAGLG